MEAREDCRRGGLLCGQLFSNPNVLIASQKIGHTLELHHITYRYSQKSYIKILFFGCYKVFPLSEKSVFFTKVDQK